MSKDSPMLTWKSRLFPFLWGSGCCLVIWFCTFAFDLVHLKETYESGLRSHDSWLLADADIWGFRIGGLLVGFLSGYLLYHLRLQPSLLEEKVESATEALRHSEHLLRDSERRLHSILSSLEDVVWSGCPKTHKLLYLSPSAERLYGIAREEFFEKPDLWMEIVHPDDQQIAREFSDVLRKTGAVQVSYRIVQPDGTVRHVIDRATVVRDADGQIVRFDGILTDVTEQVRARQALERNQQMVKDVLQGAPLFLHAIDERGVFTLSEGRGLEAIGGSPGELVGRQIEEYYPEGDPCINMWQQALSGQAFSTIYTAKNYIFETYYAPVRDNAGNISGAFCLGSDVTARQLAEEALRESESRYRHLAGATNEAVVFHKDGVILSANEAFGRMFGYKTHEMIGLNIEPMVCPTDQSRVRENIANSFEGLYEICALRKDGTTFPIEVAGKSDVPFEGQLVRVTTIRDITVEKRAKEQLIKAKLAAEEATRAKSEFLANVSHEIRTPLNAVVGLAELLSHTRLNDLQQNYTETIQRSSAALLDIINDILDFSKIEAGKLELEDLEFNLRDCVEGAADLLVHRAHHKGLRFITLIPGNVPTMVLGDPMRLRQVLTNLLSNAVKFTNEGEVILRVEPDGCGEDNIRLRFIVEDTGIGIHQEMQKKLFQPFSQVDSSTTRKYGGTGLGLAISKQLIETMGGRIDIQSIPGQGSIFAFSLPFKVCSDSAISQNRKKRAELRKTRILIADPDLRTRKNLRETLRLWGCLIVEAEKGQEILDLVQSQANGSKPVDVILLDYSLDWVQDARLLGHLRKAYQGSPPVILLRRTGQSPDEARSLAELYPISIPKPVKQEQLYTGILAMKQTKGETGAMLPARIEETPLSLRYEPDNETSKSRILIVEDNPINQVVAREMIRKAGLDCDCVSNGLEALEALEKQTYGMIFMDCQMPEMDGYETTRRIRTLQNSVSQIPIVAMTANAMNGDREKCLSAGMDDYLSKPVTLNKVREVIDKYFSGEPLILSAPPTGKNGNGKNAEENEAFDKERLELITGGDEALRTEIVQLFLADAGERLAKLKSLPQDADYEEIRRGAHSLKGSSANIGATGFSLMALGLEKAAREGLPRHEIDKIIGELERKLYKTEETLLSLARSIS